MKEFVVWGIPPGENQEVLLLTEVGGKKIKSLKSAERFKVILETEHQFRSVRIQTINLKDYNLSKEFIKTIV